MIENKDAMIELRKQGLTYKAIGEKFGISKQRVEQIIGNERVRKGNVDLDKIKYKGIYQMFVNDERMTWCKFTRIIYSVANPTTVRSATKLATGEFKRTTLTAINRLREHSGMTYEELFEERF